MQRIIKENKVYSDSEEEDKDDEDMEDIEEDEEGEDEEDEDMNSGSSDEEEETKKGKSGKQTLKARIKEEQEIRKKEKNMRNNTDQPKNVDDFERMVVANSDQSFVWI
jgi:segregation and condensation protein B